MTNTKTKQKLEQQTYFDFQQKLNVQRNGERTKFEKSFVLDKKYYNDEHLLYGSKNAKNKIVVISDPLCVACIGRVPSLIKKAQNSKNISLYYYHFPLPSLHPTAMAVSTLIEKAKADGIKDVEKRVLENHFDKIYDVYKTKDISVAVKAFNSVFKTKYTLKDAENQKYQNIIKNDMKVGDVVKLQGTPTVILNGSLYQAGLKIQKL